MIQFYIGIAVAYISIPPWQTCNNMESVHQQSISNLVEV